MAKKRTGGKKSLLLKQAIEEKFGETGVQVWYEPINGPCFEMQGYQGGWYYITNEGGEDCLGYNFDEAMKMIELRARLRNNSK